MPIVGTAGHVDHGKSSLVKALTGSDPDRLAEEKERGLTIDLGFAWATIGDHDVGFIDVPGHERFVKNMLAGVGALDCALLVVAADSGWMPQTEEHVAVLDLLEVDRGIIALSRIDLVDEDTIELAQLEILEEVSGTRLEGWPIVPVSPVSGAGIDTLAAAIRDVLDDAARPDTEAFRMWVDRVFTIDGAGLVATGTVVGGSVAVGDDVEIQPSGSTAKVRGLQHHGGEVQQSGPGSRAAVNLSGAPAGLGRGDLLCSPGTSGSTVRVLLQLSPTRTIDEIPDRGAFHLHLGTASRPVSLRRLDATDAFIATADEAFAVLAGDRVIVRDSGRRAVVAGGRVLDPHPKDRPEPAEIEALAAAVSGSRQIRADALLNAHGRLTDQQIAEATGGGRPTSGIHANGLWVSAAELDRIQDLVKDMVEQYHNDHPSRPGVPKSELASRLSVRPATLDMAITADVQLAERNEFVANTDFKHELDQTQQERWLEVQPFIESSFDVPRMSDIEMDLEAVHFLIRSGDLVVVGPDLVFTAGQAQRITSEVGDLEDGFTVSIFRDHFGMTRRQAVPTLEWLDAMGRTRRQGNGRIVRESGGP
jgi:selenocysteine-specific elongation factor